MSALNFDEAAWTGLLLQALLKASWQGGLMLLVVWVVSRTSTRMPAWLKVWLWRLAFLKLLLFALPQMQVPLLPAERPGAASDTPLRVESSPSALVKSDKAERPISAGAKERFSANGGLVSCWIFGMVCLALRLIFQWLGARRCLTAAEPVPNPWLLQECGRLAEVLGLKRTPRVLQSRSCPGPLLVGILSPAIVLPCNWASHLSSAQLRLVLSHELAHLKRRDLAWGWVTSLTEIVFFFHPLVWLCRREWALARELATDESARQATGSSAAHYGAMLLDLLDQARRPQPAVLGLGMFETKETLTRRLTGLGSARAIKHIRAAVFFVVLLGVLAIPSWRLVAQTTESDEIARLRKENQMLREELSRAKAPAGEAEAGQELERKGEFDRLDGLRLKLEEARAQLRDLSVKFTDKHPLMIAQRAKVQALERQVARFGQRGDLSAVAAELARTKEELNRLLLRIPAEHPNAQALKIKIDKLQKELSAGDTQTSRREALYQEELALAEQELAEAKARLKTGVGSQQELRKAERDMIQLKKDFDGGSSKPEKIKRLIDEEIALAEEELAEVKKRVETGLSPKGSERALQREILRLKRERAGVDQ